MGSNEELHTRSEAIKLIKLALPICEGAMMISASAYLSNAIKVLEGTENRLYDDDGFFIGD